AEDRKLSNRHSLFTDDTEYSSNDVYQNVAITYNIGGKSFKRTYYVKQSAFTENDDVRALYESKEFKENFALTNIKMLEINNISVDGSITKQHELYSGSEAQELLEAMNKDFEARTFEQESDLSNYTYVDLDITYVVNKEFGESYYNFDNRGIYVALHYSDTNTIAWLEAHGFENITDVPKEYVRSVAVLFEDSYIYASADKEMINFLLENGLRNTQGIPYNAFFAVDLYPSADAAQNLVELEKQNNEGTIEYEEYDKRSMPIKDSMFTEIYVPASKVPQEYYDRFTKNRYFTDLFSDEDVIR
ncbi:MAG: hypothetical protein J5622_02455, partial [Firmicutes bacterium]|nr:hypothetical protein [Bacillota bacterium]